ncbi:MULTISPECIES: methyltransferase domain-containing protein [Cupriavidus]|uniref:methyltransferase domain-containing protein n=1 Tax=Cupriavidus TaxID=106589 RepID=UPI00068B0866|nr:MULTISPECIES: methyltransferase domain-containing protein [Cupriavidus]HBO78999.1 methyltransferase domain-containing protein [Cupriavidus sp.]
MRDADIARRLLLAFGPNRFIVFGAMSETARSLLRDAGSEVLEQGDGLAGATLFGVAHSACSPDFLAKSCLVCLNLSDDALIAVLSDANFSRTYGVYIQHLASETLDTVESMERRAFALGYRKHPAYYRLFGYAELEQTSRELATLLEPVPATAVHFPMARLLEERDLHMDMLREAGRRSDAHVVRYNWASKFIRPNDVVIDAACGLGYGTYAMRHLSAASRFYGIDGSGWAVDYATASFASDNTEFIAGFLPDALGRFEDASVDVVVSFETLEHVAAPTALLDEFRRVLRPGGRIIVSVPNDWSDETGEDPNPHHLHVYTYERLAKEVAGGFIIEQLARQIASGCKLVDSHCQWVERPRVLEAVEPASAPCSEAEWWLAVAMKSPETGRSLAYRETVHGRFDGATHLVDFGAHYTNPWIVHAMVEIPFRLQRADELKRLARQVQVAYPRDSADHGAALAVVCYRALEEHADDAHLAQLDKQIADYLALSSDNPHIQRWQVSLGYVRARLRLRRGDRSAALADFAAVAGADITHITPTLGTKVVDAALWAGTLSWLGAEKAGARTWWRRGLTTAGQLLGSAWPEFFGNVEAPFVFAMNDAIEIADRATACSQALALTHERGDGCEAMLYGISQQSLRSALRQRDTDLISARAETAALRDEFDRVCKERHAQGEHKAVLEQASMERLERIHQLEAQLASTQSAFADAKKTALARLDSILALEARIDQTNGALEEAKALSVQRLEENVALHARLRDTDIALDAVKVLSVQRLDHILALEARIQQTNGALEEAKTLSVQRLEENVALHARLHDTDTALDAVKVLSVQRLEHIISLEARLRNTDTALNQVKAQSVQRLDEKMMLEKRIEQTDAALEEVKQLSIERLKRIEALELELRVAQSASKAASANAAERPTSVVVAADPKPAQTVETDSLR